LFAEGFGVFEELEFHVECDFYGRMAELAAFGSRDASVVKTIRVLDLGSHLVETISKNPFKKRVVQHRLAGLSDRIVQHFPSDAAI